MNKEFENKLKDIQDQFSKFGSEVQKTKLAEMKPASIAPSGPVKPKLEAIDEVAYEEEPSPLKELSKYQSKVL